MTRTLPLLLALAACAPATDTATDDLAETGSLDDSAAPSDSGDTGTEDTSTDDSPEFTSCGDPVSQFPGVVASTTDLTAFGASSIGALVDRSGLSADMEGVMTHDCSEANSFKSSNGELTGTLTFELAAAHRVEGFTIWNSGQVDGERGVRDVAVSTSLDGVTYTPVPGGELEIAKAGCPADAETVQFHATRAKYVRLEVKSTWAEDISNFGIGAIAFHGMANCGIAEVPDVVFSSDDLGTCCGTSFASLGDGSGLDVDHVTGTHTCTDEDGWKSSSSVTEGRLQMDLGAVYSVAELAIWNHGQNDGGRGVGDFGITASEDGEIYVTLDELPTTLAIADACPTTPQFLRISPPIEARYLRMKIDNAQSEMVTNVGLGEIKVFAETK